MNEPMQHTDPYATWCRPKLADLLGAVALDVEYTRASGAYLYREVAGQEVAVLDMVGGFGAGLFGHNHPVLKAAMHRLLDADTPFLAQCASRGSAGRLAQRLNALLPGDASYLTHFTNDGAGAVEAVLKHAYKVRFDALRRTFEQVSRDVEAFHNAHESRADELQVPGGLEWGRFRDELDEYNIAELERFQHRPVVLALKGAFHGKTTGALKLTFNKAYREGFEGLSAIHTQFLDPSDLLRVEEIVAGHPIRFRLPVLCGRTVEIEERSANAVILLALEVIQGEGGMRPVPEEALRAVASARTRIDLPCLIDEIQTGCGRTGSFVAFADSPLTGTEPEYVTLSKALGGGLVKLGAALIREDIYDHDFGILHTSTFAEDELSSGVAHCALDLLTANDGAMMRGVAVTGDYLLRGLRSLATRFPGVVRDVRGRGLMIGVEFTDLHEASPFFRFGIRQGFLSLVVASYLLHHHQVRILAPLTTLLKGNPGKKRQAILRLQPAAVISRAECDRVLAGLAEVFKIIAHNNESVLVGHLVGATPDAATRRNPPIIAVERPMRARRDDFDARIGFVLHPAQPSQLIDYYLPSMRDRVDPSRFTEWWNRMARFLEPDVVHTDYITANGFTVEASIIATPFLPGPMMEACQRCSNRSVASRDDWRRLEEMQDKIQDAVTFARELGDDHIPTTMVGLGAFTSIITDQGRSINDFEVPITTGNAYTAGLMVEGIAHAAELRGLRLEECTAAVVGAAGNIGSVLAAMLAGRVAALRLIGREGVDSVRRLELARAACIAEAPNAAGRITIHTTLDAVGDADIVTVATSSAESRLIGPDIVKLGAIVSCASVPSNLSGAFHDRLDDFVVFDGGFARLPGGQEVDCVGFPGGGLAFGCFSETVLLGLAGHDRSFARGAITPGQVRTALRLAAEQGFVLGELKLDGQPYPTGALT